MTEGDPNIINLQTELENEFLVGAEYPDIDFFHLNGLKKWAKVVRICDGDTLVLVFFVNGRPQKWRCRLAEIDTAEKNSKDPAEVAHAHVAMARMEELINDRLIWVEVGKMGRYWRPLVKIYQRPGQDPIDSFNQIMVGEGLAYEYHGGTRVPFREWVLEQFTEDVPAPSEPPKPVDNIQDSEVLEHAEMVIVELEDSPDYQTESNIEQVHSDSLNLHRGLSGRKRPWWRRIRSLHRRRK